MPDELPRTDVDTFAYYQWQMTSAVRPCWHPDKNPTHPLYREAYIGSTCLAEPAHKAKYGPPYVILKHTASDGAVHWQGQEEVGFEFTKADAARTVRRVDALAIAKDTPSLFDHA
jgi:hypothetical protein